MIRIITVVKLTETFTEDEVLIAAYVHARACARVNKHVSIQVECQLSKLVFFLIYLFFSSFCFHIKRFGTSESAFQQSVSST